MLRRLYLPTLITICYFIISWGVSWDNYSHGMPVSLSYFFDIFFVIAISLVYKAKPNLDFRRLKFFVPRLGSTLLLAVASIYISRFFSIDTPFRYIEIPMIQLLILAPVIEEFVFRHAFMSIFVDSGLNLRFRIWINSGLFSLSHLPGLWAVPEEFRPFIVFQMGYTLLLGRICAMGKFKYKSILGPIVLHLAFNLVFAISLSLKLI